MFPVVLVSKTFELVNQTMSHWMHAARHILEVLVPHGSKLRVSQNDINNTSTMDRRVRIDWSSNLLDTGLSNLSFFLTSSDNRKASSTLTIETEVLCKRLEKTDVIGMLLEETDWVRISIEVSWSESLVSAVKTAEKFLCLYDIKNVLPLGISWVNTSWIVSTNVEHDKRMILCCLKIFRKSFEIEALSCWVIVSVIFSL